ncbi:hypothetical protein [Nonomuraea roseola]|uniref:Ricin B lectin domain-containing protein n=1 Tax=Nonomuraea roseola TaxID=46179 RepID=A0ABV5PYJ3_9ACTN
MAVHLTGGVVLAAVLAAPAFAASPASEPPPSPPLFGEHSLLGVSSLSDLLGMYERDVPIPVTSIPANGGFPAGKFRIRRGTERSMCIGWKGWADANPDPDPERPRVGGVPCADATAIWSYRAATRQLVASDGRCLALIPPHSSRHRPLPGLKTCDTSDPQQHWVAFANMTDFKKPDGTHRIVRVEDRRDALAMYSPSYAVFLAGTDNSFALQAE